MRFLGQYEISPGAEKKKKSKTSSSMSTHM